MSLASVLNIAIPAAVIAYALYLIARMARARAKGAGGCTGCPYSGSCSAAHKKECKRDEP